MFTREELLRSPEYWFEDAQNELYRQVIAYKERKGITQTQLAEELGVSKGYVSQILKGEFNYTLKTLIDISLAIGCVPKIEYKTIEAVIADDNKTEYLQNHYLPFKEMVGEVATTELAGELAGSAVSLVSEPVAPYNMKVA